jgi:ubiquinone/menaquinone biosynthesis C-methylase UbiE
MTSPPPDFDPGNVPLHPEHRPKSRGAGRLYAAFAFGPGGAIYDLVTDQPAWRRDCRELGALVDGPRVLDLGVGSGLSAVEMARAAPARRHVGVDISARMLRKARARSLAEGLPLPLLRADVGALPFRAGTFDGASGHSILYLVADPAATLAELRRVLRPGGRVAFLEPRAGAPALSPPFRAGLRHGLAMVLWRTMSRVHRRYDERSLLGELTAAGFRDARAWPVLDGFGVMGTAARA